MYIVEVETKKVRPYGSDKHDALSLSPDGKYLVYENLQTGLGSYDEYRFCVDESGKIPLECDEHNIYGADAYFNIGGFNTDKYSLKRGEKDLDELELRFGKEVRDVVSDMISGKDERFLEILRKD